MERCNTRVGSFDLLCRQNCMYSKFRVMAVVISGRSQGSDEAGLQAGFSLWAAAWALLSFCIGSLFYLGQKFFRLGLLWKRESAVKWYFVLGVWKGHFSWHVRDCFVEESWAFFPLLYYRNACIKRHCALVHWENKCSDLRLRFESLLVLFA